MKEGVAHPAPHSHMTTGPRRAITHAGRVLLLSYLAAACSVSHVHPPSSLAYPDMPPIAHARVHLMDGSVQPLSDVIVASDTVAGFTEPAGARVAIPAASVSSIEEVSASPGRTVALMGGIVVGVAVVGAVILGYVITHSHWDF